MFYYLLLSAALVQFINHCYFKKSKRKFPNAKFGIVNNCDSDVLVALFLNGVPKSSN